MISWFPYGRRGWEYRDEPPEGGRLQMWLGGVVLAAFPAVYGLRCLVLQRAILPSRFGLWTATNSAAIAAGIAYLGLGGYLHFHWFWGLHRRLSPLCGLGKTASLVAIGGGLMYLCFVVLVCG